MTTKFICTETDPVTGDCMDEYEAEVNEEVKGFILWNHPDSSTLVENMAILSPKIISDDGN